ncbi:MAG: phage tail sheath family protein [Candidatus Dormibacteria bacterium]
MPEYLTPGVYVEETSFRSRSIEGVPTSTFGMAGLTRYGPVPYVLPTTPAVVMVPKPTLVASFTEFERAFGGLGPAGTLDDDPNYLGYAARAFFDNGGRRLYVSRVFSFTPVSATDDTIDAAKNFAALPLPGATPAVATWRARWPGDAGKSISVKVAFRRSKNVIIGGKITGLAPGAAVETGTDPKNPPKDDTPPDQSKIKIIAKDIDGTLGFKGAVGFENVGTTAAAFHITLDVTIRTDGDRLDTYTGLELNGVHPRAISKVLQAERPTDDLSLIWLDVSATAADAALLTALLALKDFQFLSGGGEGQALTPDALKGTASDPDDATRAATGLAALGEIDDIAIVATPDSVRFTDPASQKTAGDYLIEHCENLRYRIGIVDPPADDRSVSAVRAFRAQFDTKYAALYYPWVEILDPTAKNDPGAPPATLELPPSGFAAGIYARSDIARGVHKAPANEVVLGITKFTQNVTYDRQAVLNPEGINALRFFEGRSNRIWGARTMSSDPEWKYVNVRRLFIYLEHSIDKSTQWAVFEPNNERLWASIRQTIEDFLLVTWRTGALMGTKPEQAYFVRCDRTTMTQNDLDNGRLICLIGVAPTYPVEFVIFRIGQWTADAQQS